MTTGVIVALVRQGGRSGADRYVFRSAGESPIDRPDAIGSTLGQLTEVDFIF
ncbi:hypothetical protein [Inquilinus sp.]|jgi:hypothetical protein|uniref:hypothetical protein n=1 Tax=Inquilinus sp. TaxID=1932117 RepID=UPI00378461CD